MTNRLHSKAAELCLAHSSNNSVKLQNRCGSLNLAEPGLTAGWQAGRQAGRLADRLADRPADKIWARLEVLKACYRSKYSIFPFV